MSTRLILKVAATAIVVALLGTSCVFILSDEAWDNLDADLKIVAEWDDDYNDVDLYVSYPDPSDGDTTDNSGDPDFTELYYDNEDLANIGDPGFFLSDSTTLREIVSPSATKSTATFSGASAVEMTQEAKAGGPEIVLIRRPPFDSTLLSYATTPVNSLGLSTSYQSFAWIGVGEIYVDGDSGKLVSSGGYSANVSVTIYNDSGNALARLMLPEDMDLTSMSVARIHYFVAKDFGGTDYNYYVIVPDVRTIPGGPSDFRSASATTAVYGDGAIGIVGSARE